MTEDEAKTKICHRSIDGDDSPATVISNEMFAKKFACVGSKCMAWRRVVLPGEGAWRENLQTKAGYCGLAGKP